MNQSIGPKNQAVFTKGDLAVVIPEPSNIHSAGVTQTWPSVITLTLRALDDENNLKKKFDEDKKKEREEANKNIQVALQGLVKALKAKLLFKLEHKKKKKKNYCSFLNCCNNFNFISLRKFTTKLN